MGNPFTGAGYFLRGLKLILQPGLRRFVAIPLSINLALFGGLLWFGASQFGDLLDHLMATLPDWLQWAEWLFWVLFGLSAALILFYAFSLLANIVAAPFNALLAEAVEIRLTGDGAGEGADWRKMLAELVPTLIDELRKLLYLAGWSIPFLILFFVPGLNILAPFLWLAFTAWMLVLEYLDYPMGNHGLRSDEQKGYLRTKRLMVMGFGTTVTLATMTPVLNFLVMPAAVAGATAMWVEQFRGRRDELVDA